MASVEQETLSTLSQNVPAALATVIHRAGSAPRGVGAKMLIRADGSSVGTIGGGVMEAQVMEAAKHVLETGEARVVRFELSAKDLAEEGSICGGNVSIFVEPVTTDVPDILEIFRRIVKTKQRGGRSVLATIVSVNEIYPKGIHSKALIDETGPIVGSLLDDQRILEQLKPQIEPLLAENRSRILSLEQNRERIDVLLEPIVSEPTVFIFGCGHISTCLAPLAKRVGFRVVVTDDRAEFANRERFPDVDEIVLAPFEDLLKTLEIDENAYLTIVTRGHLHDLVVLEQALDTPARYIGMIGSGRKIKMVYANLIEKRIPRERLERVHAPIGLDIRAETPEEIAVSILAELIQVRAGRT